MRWAAHAARVDASGWRRCRKSTAFCAWAAALKIARLSFLRTVSHVASDLLVLGKSAGEACDNTPAVQEQNSPGVASGPASASELR